MNCISNQLELPKNLRAVKIRKHIVYLTFLQINFAHKNSSLKILFLQTTHYAKKTTSYYNKYKKLIVTDLTRVLKAQFWAQIHTVHNRKKLEIQYIHISPFIFILRPLKCIKISYNCHVNRTSDVLFPISCSKLPKNLRELSNFVNIKICTKIFNTWAVNICQLF